MKWLFKKKLVDSASIKEFETTYHIRLPEELKELISEANGARPNPYIIDAETTKEIPAKALLSFNQTDTPEDIWSTYDAIKHKLPHNIIPFMSDEGGNYFCLDLDPLETQHPIVYWHHEKKDLEVVATNLTVFLHSFYDF